MAEEAPMCANNCGFYGNPATNNLCSKCYRDSIMAATVAPAVEKMVSVTPSPSFQPTTTNVGDTSDKHVQEPPKPSTANRCLTCRKKVGLTGFKCRCGGTFCGIHRYADAHGCSFDYKKFGKERIKKENPLVRADKIARI